METKLNQNTSKKEFAKTLAKHFALGAAKGIIIGGAGVGIGLISINLAVALGVKSSTGLLASYVIGNVAGSISTIAMIESDKEEIESLFGIQ